MQRPSRVVEVEVLVLGRVWQLMRVGGMGLMTGCCPHPKFFCQDNLLLGIGGTAANIVFAISLVKLFTTGCGLPAGPLGLYGLLEGLSYLTVPSIFAYSIYNKVQTGSGLPAGKYGLVGLAEGLSFLAVIAGALVLFNQVQSARGFCMRYDRGYLRGNRTCSVQTCQSCLMLPLGCDWLATGLRLARDWAATGLDWAATGLLLGCPHLILPVPHCLLRRAVNAFELCPGLFVWGQYMYNLPPICHFAIAVLEDPLSRRPAVGQLAADHRCQSTCNRQQ